VAFSLYVGKNLLRIVALENLRPGSALTLYQEFGIMNFGRYPVMILAHQYDQRDDVSRPYVAMSYPRSDHESAFSPSQKMRSWDELEESWQQLWDGTGAVHCEVNIRIFEAGTRIDYMKQLTRLNQRYGDHHKISALLIAAHGDPGRIQIGPNEFISLDDLSGQGLSRAGLKFLAPVATITLSSCATGAANGIGKTLSRQLGCRVIAPEQDTYVESLVLDVSQTIHDIRIMPIYADDVNRVIYENGVKVEGQDR